MDKNNDYIYFVNSQGRSVVLSDPKNTRYWEMKGRYGFDALDVDIFTSKFASGETKYFGKAIKPRTCGLRMILKGETSAECDRLFFEMLDVLLDADGDKEGKLYVKRFDGGTVCLNCVYSSGMRVAREYRDFRKFTVEFYAADPWFYDERRYNLKDGSTITITNLEGKTLYPYIYICEILETSSTGTEYTYVIQNRTSGDEITFMRYSANPSKTYDDVEIFTNAKDRGIYAVKQKKTSKYGYLSEAVPELLNNHMEYLDFRIIPGSNVIYCHIPETAGQYVDKSHIVVGFPKAGA